MLIMLWEITLYSTCQSANVCPKNAEGKYLDGKTFRKSLKKNIVGIALIIYGKLLNDVIDVTFGFILFLMISKIINLKTMISEHSKVRFFIASFNSLAHLICILI